MLCFSCGGHARDHNRHIGFLETRCWWRAGEGFQSSAGYVLADALRSLYALARCLYRAHEIAVDYATRANAFGNLLIAMKAWGSCFAQQYGPHRAEVDGILVRRCRWTARLGLPKARWQRSCVRKR